MFLDKGEDVRGNRAPFWVEHQAEEESCCGGGTSKGQGGRAAGFPRHLQCRGLWRSWELRVPGTGQVTELDILQQQAFV